MRNARTPPHVVTHVSSSIGSVFGKALSARLMSVNSSADQVLDQVLAFSAEERSALAIALLDSLANSGSSGVSDASLTAIKQRVSSL